MSAHTTPGPARYTAFEGMQRLARGALPEVAQAVARAARRDGHGVLLVFDDRSGDQVDLDLRGDDADIAARYGVPEPVPADPAPRGRGRPRLGVVAREVTLLPRHWDWLAAQPGGASVVLRRLVDEARKAHPDRDRLRGQRERAYRFMAAIAGNQAGFEEASRALFAGDRDRLDTHTADWPADVRAHLLQLAFHSDGADD